MSGAAWLYAVQDEWGRELAYVQHDSPDLVARVSPHSDGGHIVQLVDPSDETVVTSALAVPGGMVMARWDAAAKTSAPVAAERIEVP